MDAGTAIKALENFTGENLTRTLASIEREISGKSGQCIPAFLQETRASQDILSAAAEVKRFAGQINVTIHALGILLSLPHLLEDGEQIEYVSLGAGNTGRKFDLETNYRIAEFKFINWRGGPESIRQNSIFKDFFELAIADTPKRKYLYLLGTVHALKFFQGRRAIVSVLSKNQATSERFSARCGTKYSTVAEFFAAYRDTVIIEDLSSWLPELCSI